MFAYKFCLIMKTGPNFTQIQVLRCGLICVLVLRKSYLTCFVLPIFLSFGFWYFGHFSCVIFFPFFPSCPSCLAKCKQRLHNFIVNSLPKMIKNQKRNLFIETTMSIDIKTQGDTRHKTARVLDLLCPKMSWKQKWAIDTWSELE